MKDTPADWVAPRERLVDSRDAIFKKKISAQYNLDEETLARFAVQKLRETNSAAALPDSPVVRKWWDYMAPLLETNPDNSPAVTNLCEVFRLD